MDFILEHKWLFLIIAEAVFWVSVSGFLLLRYWFGLQRLSIVFFLLFIVNDLWIATMGFFDYQQTGTFSSYQILILIFILYALIYGKNDFTKVDAFIQRKAARWKGQPLPIIEDAGRLYGKEHAQQERKQFFQHLLVYLTAHLGFALAFGLSPDLSNLSNLQGWFAHEQLLLPFQHETVNRISNIWSLLLIIDGVISLSYTFFPKEKPAKHVSRT